MKLLKFIFSVCVCTALFSCGTHQNNIVYFQDISTENTIQLLKEQLIKVKPEDRLSIVVASKDSELMKLLNPIAGRKDLSGTARESSSSMSLYTVDKDGTIEFPQLGRISVLGKTRLEVAVFIKEQLTANSVVKDPTVTVDFHNTSITVLGEVHRPGRYEIENDRYTILDALAKAGDLTINGNRKNVSIIRTNGDEQEAFDIDLTSMESLTQSPGYYLQQGDCIYVEPNDKRQRESTVNGNRVRSTAFWISITTLALSFSHLLIKLLQ